MLLKHVHILIFILQLHPLRWSLIHLTNHNSWWYTGITVWHITGTWRGVATLKAACTVLDSAQYFDMWCQQASTFCHELLRLVNVAVPTAIRKSCNIINSSNNFCINANIYECKYKDWIDIWLFLFGYEKHTLNNPTVFHTQMKTIKYRFNL
jgi:hypothetical protein